MIITYQRGDLVEYKGIYWRIQFCNQFSKTVDLRNAAGRTVDDVSLDLIKPCAVSIQNAAFTATNDQE